MALYFNPDLSRDAIISALAHDLGEFATGDISYMVKLENPKLAEDIQQMERDVIQRLGFSAPDLPWKEASLIKLCDWIDAWMWMLHHTPHLRGRDDWMSQKDKAMQLAYEIGMSGGHINELRSL